VERSVYDTFVQRFVEEARKLTIGDPLESTTRIGAIVSKIHYEKILSYIQLAKDEGGQIILGGNTVNPSGRCAEGWFIEPTIVTGLDNLCRTQQEEVFGPFVTITPFDTETEAIEMANQSTYGLSATIWTENLNRAHRVAAAIESGIIWVNCWLLRDLRTPFGGMKNSGIGREGGWEAMRFFTEPKNVCIKFN
jgi:aminomuconate-semialdehyde/2-hydroxymuconate-6-semialdehyde dehydrogenase